MIAILSDIHANLEALEAVLREIREERIDTIVCLGDIVGYNADPSACIRLLREADAVCVAGNHDRAVTRQIAMDGFNPLAVRAVEWTRSRLSADEICWLASLPLKTTVDGRLIAVHDALHAKDSWEFVRLDSQEKMRLSFDALAESGINLCAFGHTHRLGLYEMRKGMVMEHEKSCRIVEGSLYLVNPGTVGQPKEKDLRASYLVLEPSKISVRRVRYDVGQALAKTRKAGLAPRLSFLPTSIREPLRHLYHAVLK